jgi:hypothetical protein
MDQGLQFEPSDQLNKVQTRNFGTWSWRFELKLNQIFFIRLAFD